VRWSGITTTCRPLASVKLAGAVAVVWAEARVYSVVQDKVLWVGESVSTNTTTVAAFVKELSAQATDGVKKAGLLGK